MNVLKKQFVKRNYHKETLKITIDMAWPAIVESFFVAFAGLIDSLMVSSLGSYAVAAVGLTTQPKLLGLALFFALNVAIWLLSPVDVVKRSRTLPMKFCLPQFYLL